VFRHPGIGLIEGAGGPASLHVSALALAARRFVGHRRVRAEGGS
jgi:hypothetical protein